MAWVPNCSSFSPGFLQALSAYNVVFLQFPGGFFVLSQTSFELMSPAEAQKRLCDNDVLVFKVLF